MTASGTWSFGTNTTSFSLLSEAWERVGKRRSTLSADDFDSARRSLEYFFSEISNRGINLWTITLNSTALTVGQQTITLNANMVDVLQVYTRTTSGTTNNDLMIFPISRAEYAALPDKAQQGSRPTQFYFERTIVPTLYLWPTPQDTSVTLNYYTMLMQQDAGAYTNTLDAPQRWFDAMASAVAARLAVKWAPERAPALQILADRAFDFAAAEDTENVPLRIVPDVLGRRYV